MTYQEALQFVNDLQMHKIKLGLEAMRSFLEKVGGPEQRLPTVHVAGTNGKGSVSVTILTILQQAGKKVGLYTSPHLSSVRERIRINDRYISEAEFAAIATRIVAVLDGEVITYFEFTTALALLWFVEQQPDLVVLETGMGGRLDATNVVTPLVSVITSISMDHEAYLGNTLRAVAGEKAGIIKAGRPVVAAGGAPEVVAVLTAAAQTQAAPIYLLGRDFTCQGDSNDDWSWIATVPELGGGIAGLRCAMKGAYQRENASLAIAALRLLAGQGFPVDNTTLRIGLAQVRWPGRLEYFTLPAARQQELFGEAARRQPVHFLLDGAHNPDGVAKLADTLREEYADFRLILVFGAMLDKDIRGGLACLAPLVSQLILTRPEGERAAEPEQLLANLADDQHHKAILVRDPLLAIQAAVGGAGSQELIVVAGSLYLIGAVRTSLLGEIARDGRS